MGDGVYNTAIVSGTTPTDVIVERHLIRHHVQRLTILSFGTTCTITELVQNPHVDCKNFNN
jgi:hypothetical protein